MSDNSVICNHELPEPGLSFVLRRNEDSEWRYLYISRIPDTVLNPEFAFLVLAFDNDKSYLSLEKKIRDKLQGISLIS